jgi:hypothetical protein
MFSTIPYYIYYITTSPHYIYYITTSPHYIYYITTNPHYIYYITTNRTTFTTLLTTRLIKYFILLQFTTEKKCTEIITVIFNAIFRHAEVNRYIIH